MIEEWRVVPSFPDYEASNLGNIRRHGRILKSSKRKNGYLKLTLIDVAGRRCDVLVHRAICETFHGPCAPGMQCAHRDGTRTNNQASNLHWVTPQRNQFDRIEHGTTIIGEQVKNSKLTAAVIPEIRRRRASGERCMDLAIEYGVSEYAISKVCLRKNWRHV